MAKPIGTLGTIPTLTIGGRVFTDLTTIKMLYARQGGDVRSSFRLANGTSGYAVTGGTTLTVYAVAIIPNDSSTIGFQLAYSDNDVGSDTNTAFTNPVYWMGASNALHQVAAVGSGMPEAVRSFALNFQVLAAKYPGLQISTAARFSMILYGYEA